MQNPDIDHIERSRQYRSELSAASAVPGTSLVVYERGHGTALMIAEAAGQAGAKTALFVVPKLAQELYLDQLRRMGFTASAASGKKGAIEEICRQAAAYQDGKPAIFIAAPNDMVKAGHWCDAWKQQKPFGFVAVLDAENFRNMNSEKNQGLKDVITRAGNAVLLVGHDTDPVKTRALARAWDLHIVTILPRPAHAVASGCEAMAMDAD